jgi:4-amino-4-deoxy-L-arabinose transferase-like glycosyltransferase
MGSPDQQVVDWTGMIDDKGWKSRTIVALLLMAMAGCLRYYRLGDWPFAGDETYTIAEAKIFLNSDRADPDSQLSRLPRIIPLSYAVHAASVWLFGADEWGSRVLLALCGTLSVGLTFALLDGPLGRPTAIATALLMTLWPEHVFQSQQTRFYIVAGLMGSACLLVGGQVATRRSTALGLLLSLLLLAAIFCHTLLGVLIPIVGAGIVLAWIADRQPWSMPILALLGGTMAAAAGVYVFYLRPLVAAWNPDEGWGYDSAHAVQAAINDLGWPVMLLTVVGFLWMVSQRRGVHWYWATMTLGWGVATLSFPLLVAYHPEYVFALALGALVPAGFAIGTIYQSLLTTSRVAAVAWLLLASAVNLPSLASHYLDGSRIDIRSAAEHVATHWQAGDRVAGYSMGLFQHYARQCEPRIPLAPEDVQGLERLTAEPGRVWIVLESTRARLDPATQAWLGSHTSHELQVRKKRLDYPEYTVDVFLYPRAAP